MKTNKYPTTITMEFPVADYKEAKKLNGAILMSGKDWAKLKKFMKAKLTPEQHANLPKLGINIQEMKLDF